MAEGATIANAFVQIMPSAEGATNAIADAILPGMEGIGDEAGSMFGAGLLQNIGALAGPLAAAIGALGIGKMLMDVGAGFDEMHDAIVIGTGASGDALDELMRIAEDVATTVPVSFGTAGDYIQDLNTRLGLTGDDLQTVATQLGALDSMVGGVNVEALSGAFAAWGVSAEDMGAEMDYLFGVSQATGLSFDSLTGILERNAPAMQQLGFSFEETANMAGLLDRAGMDASGMMGKMSKALQAVVNDGGDAGEAFNSMLDEMQGFIDAGDTASAMDIAQTLFGTKGATQFLQAVEDGTMSIESIRDAALGAGDGIMGTYESTKSWGESLEVLKNKAALALEPLASGVFEALGTAIDVLTGAFDELAPAIQPIIEELGGILVETVMPALTTAFETVSPIISDLGHVFLTVAGVVVGAVGKILGVVLPAFNKILSVASSTWNGIKAAIKGPIESARDIVKAAIEKIKSFFNVTLKFPDIKLPHFRISGGKAPWGLGGAGTAPSIGIDWYAQGGLFDGASLIGVGERGAELAWPSYEPYMSKYAAAIAEHMPEADVAAEIRALREDVRNLKVYLDTGALVGGITPQMDGSLGRRTQYAGRGVV